MNIKSFNTIGFHFAGMDAMDKSWMGGRLYD
jgi:hypothetical protein